MISLTDSFHFRLRYVQPPPLSTTRAFIVRSMSTLSETVTTKKPVFTGFFAAFSRCHHLSWLTKNDKFASSV
jgi:hypothetical protein